MSFELDPIYVVYLLVAVSAGLFVEGVYLLFFSGASYRKNVNRRLKLLRNEPNRENLLVQLRKERGLTSAGNYRVGVAPGKYVVTADAGMSCELMDARVEAGAYSKVDIPCDTGIR